MKPTLHEHPPRRRQQFRARALLAFLARNPTATYLPY
jgi:hypothetical protein